MRFSIPLALVLLTTACGADAPSAAPALSHEQQGLVAGMITAVAQRSHVTLRNSTEFAIGYRVVDKDQAIIMLYPPCTLDCKTLVQGATVEIPYSAIDGYTPRSTQAIVLYWTYVPGPDGKPVADGPIHSLNVNLN